MTKIVAANWKMHHGPEAAARFFLRFSPGVDPASVRLLFFPPDLSLAASAAGARVPVEFGVQDVHWEPQGAFTGETSAAIAREAGATLVLAGHSERRHVFGETEDEAGRKAAAALRAGLVPVVCVGEQLEERRSGCLRKVLKRQLLPVLTRLADAIAPKEAEQDVGEGADSADASFAHRLILAYEPVWAIGTGETATPDDAAQAHAMIREIVRDLGPAGADEAPILYGGSVGPSTARALLSAPGVDGVLVGGASLDPAALTDIAVAAEKAARSTR